MKGKIIGGRNQEVGEVKGLRHIDSSVLLFIIYQT